MYISIDLKINVDITMAKNYITLYFKLAPGND